MAGAINPKFHGLKRRDSAQQSSSTIAYSRPGEPNGMGAVWIDAIDAPANCASEGIRAQICTNRVI
jgi:hypothetical protein